MMVFEQVRDFVIREFLPGQDPTELTPETPLLSSGIIDSVGTLRLVLYLEQTYAVEIDAADIADGGLETLELIARLVSRKQAAHRATAADD